MASELSPNLNIYLIDKGHLRAKHLIQLAALTVTVLGTYSLALFAFDLGTPIAANSAGCLIMTGLALFLITLDRRRSIAVAELLGLAVFVVGLVAVVGHLYRFPPLYNFGSAQSMDLVAGAVFMLLGLGLFFARPERGPATIISQDSAGGSLARRLLPAAIAVPILLGWLRVEGERSGLYKQELGLAVFTLFVTIIFAILITRYANLENREAKKRAAAEDALRAERDRLALLNRELESFSYSVSHDLRTPLNKILGFSRALEEDCRESLDQSGQEFLDRLTRSAKLMRELIDGMLVLSQVNQAKLELEQVDLSKIVRDTTQQFKKDNPSRAGIFTIAEDQIVEADPRLMQSLLRNLLDNAWKYSAEKSVTEIEFGAIARDGSRVFFVRDNGAGFEPSKGEQIFAPFQRLHREGGPSGCGIGLATVQRVVHRHGGRVWAESQPGHGTTVFFMLGNNGDSRAMPYSDR